VTPFDGAAIVTVMTRAEAEQCEAEIVSTGSRLRALLVEFYERRGWDALGYSSWRSWSSARLGASENMAYRELMAGRLERELFDDSQKIGLLPETHLRPLAPLRDDPEMLRETWDRAQQMAEGEGKPLTARHVSAAVHEYRAGAPLPDDEPLTPYEEAIAAAYEAPDKPTYTPPVSRFTEGMRSSDSAEWYTPATLIERARQLLGTIDLDPASSAEAQRTVQAVRWCGLDHPDSGRRDGLAREWPGHVWMNPPYGDTIGEWVARLVHQYENGPTTEALALLPARTDTAWWQDNLRAYGYCAIRGRLRFSGAENSAPFPSALIYLGDNFTLFHRTFSSLGLVYPPPRSDL